ncbi:MAG: ParA family protein [Gammaproteobacteria bacterium]|nr:MAG: ParA family protein [Gammaproteobacteria bacterium]
MTTLVIANQKGGVGKTTTALNLAASLSAASRKVLLIDLDSQKNSTSASGVNTDASSSLLDVLIDNKPINSVILKTEFKFDLIPASQDLISAEMELININNPTAVLKEKLRQIKYDYDYIVIDCPPSLGMLSVSALRAADKVLIPLQCEYYSLEGLAAMNQTIQEINSSTGDEIKISVILRTMFDTRNKSAREVSQELEKHFAEELCTTVIPRNVKLSEAPSYGMPALYYEPEAKGTIAYLALAGELINKYEKNSAA